MINAVYKKLACENPGQPLKIVVFDNDNRSRRKLRLIIEEERWLKVVGYYNITNNVVNEMIAGEADMAVLDIDSAGDKGLQTLERLKLDLPHIPVLVFTSAEDDAVIYQAIMAGASGYILKNESKFRFLSAIREIWAGGSPMSPSVSRRVINMIKSHGNTNALIKPAPDYKLTNREKDVLSRIVKGKSYKMIGYELNISYETVRSHMKKIYEKLHVASLTEAVAKSIHLNIV